MTGLNPYAPPQADLEISLPGQSWRKGTLLVVRRDDPELPPRCVKCNAEALPDPDEHSLRWGSLLTLHYRRIHIEIPLCAAHARGYQQRTQAYRVCFLAGALLLAVYGALLHESAASPYPTLVALILMFGSSFLQGYNRALSPRRIDEEFAWLKGAGPAFLASLPEFPSRL